MEYKVGIGYDIHRLIDGRPLFIGGIEIPYIKGFLGHSDGDVLLHAICDALLGAAGLKDIGELFPDSDPQYERIVSSRILDEVNILLGEKKYKICNIDAVLIAEEPVISPFKKKIEENIAAILRIQTDVVNIKAKTNEKLDDIGKKEAIACYAVTILSRGGEK